MPDALYPLDHGLSGVARKPDGHRFKVDDETPLVVGGDQRWTGGGGAEERLSQIERSYTISKGLVTTSCNDT